jgi:hypothetical protein
VAISTKAALREMMLPGVITIVTPIIIGMVMGAEALGAYMAGVTVSGVLWAIFQNNAGGAWDNAKKSFEKGVEIEVNGKKEVFYKKSEPHKAAVVGDTVGDPFKDTSGPSMNILIKLSCLVGLTLAPMLGNHSQSTSGDCCHKGHKTECTHEGGEHGSSCCSHKEGEGHSSECTHHEGEGKMECSGHAQQDSAHQEITQPETAH